MRSFFPPPSVNYEQTTTVGRRSFYVPERRYESPRQTRQRGSIGPIASHTPFNGHEIINFSSENRRSKTMHLSFHFDHSYLSSPLLSLTRDTRLISHPHGTHHHHDYGKPHCLTQVEEYFHVSSVGVVNCRVVIALPIRNACCCS